MADSSGTTLMELITADPSTASASASTTTSSSASTQPAQSTGYAASPPKSSSGGLPTALGKPAGEKRSKRAALMQIQNDTISAAKAALNPVGTNINILPQKHKHKQKKPVSYAQLARSIHEVAAASDQKSSQKQLVNHVFPKLAVYNSVDPSVAPSLLMLNQQCEDRSVLRYVYYYLARILSDTGAQGVSTGGGIPTPNWDALAALMLLEG